MPRFVALALLLLGGPGVVSAAQRPVAAVQTPDPGVIGATPSEWRFGIALGYGLRSNPLIQSEDIPIIVDLDIAWFGERFFFDNGDLGLTLTDNDRLTLNLVARLNSDRVFFGKTNTRFVQIDTGATGPLSVRVTVPDRDYALELGAEVLTDGDWGRLQFSAFQDVSSTHGGYELSATYSFGVRRQRWYLEPSLGISLKGSKLNAYYWGIRQIESSPALPAYQPDGGINAGIRLLGSYQLTPGWSFSIAAEYERMNDAAARSPIVAEGHVLGFFAGFGYRF
jgi:outer membrane protein